MGTGVQKIEFSYSKQIIKIMLLDPFFRFFGPETVVYVYMYMYTSEVIISIVVLTTFWGCLDLISI